MAKVRIRLKDLNRTLTRLTNDLKKLQGKGANRAAEKGLRTLHQSLSRAQKLMAAQCPEVQFRNFDIAAPRAVKGARRKSTRGGTRRKR